MSLLPSRKKSYFFCPKSQWACVYLHRTLSYVQEQNTRISANIRDQCLTMSNKFIDSTKQKCKVKAFQETFLFRDRR